MAERHIYSLLVLEVGLLLPIEHIVGPFNGIAFYLRGYLYYSFNNKLN
jgi:hypothetical protein